MMETPPLVDGRIAGRCVLDDKRVATMLQVFDGRGEETRVVGGAVRNTCLGLAVSEVDFATTATPDIVMRRADEAHLRHIPTGIEHGTITILVDAMPFELTTLREDVETDGRRARVVFGRSFEHDALRRDFTMNALSLGADRRVHDYTGGLADIAARRVRFIGAARQRIREDYLRILRYFRFHASYGAGAMDREAFHAIIQEREGLAILSRERIRAELMKLIGSQRAADVIAEVSQTGLLQPILAGIVHPARLARAIDIERAAMTDADAELRFIALMICVAEDAERLRDRLRLSNAEAERAIRAAQVAASLHGIRTAPDERVLCKCLFAFGRQAASDGLRLAHAEAPAAPDDMAWLAAMRFLQETPEPRLPFRGADLIARGVPAGQAVGQRLKRLQASWIRAGFPRDPVILAGLLEEAVSDLK